jgi:hypothetical protein
MADESLAVVKQKEKSQTGSDPIFTRLQLLMKGVKAESLQYRGQSQLAKRDILD